MSPLPPPTILDVAIVKASAGRCRPATTVLRLLPWAADLADTDRSRCAAQGCTGRSRRRSAGRTPVLIGTPRGEPPRY